MPSTRNEPANLPVRRKVLLGVALLSLTGCMPATPGTGAAGGPPTSVPASPSPSPAASEGSDPASCDDATCEVRVAGPLQIPVDPVFQVGAVYLEPVNDEVSVTITIPGSALSFACHGDEQCKASAVSGTVVSPGMAQAFGRAGTRIMANGIVVEIVTVAHGSAIVRLTPAPR